MGFSKAELSALSQSVLAVSCSSGRHEIANTETNEVAKCFRREIGSRG